MAVEEYGHIIHQSSPYMSQSKVLEKNKSEIDQQGTFVLENSGTPKRYRGDAIIQVADLYIRTAAKNLNLQALINALLGTTPTNSNLWIFGCALYPQIRMETRADRFKRRAEIWIYRRKMHVLLQIYRLTIRREILTILVSFNENLFPLSRESPIQTNTKLEHKPTVVNEQTIFTGDTLTLSQTLIMRNYATLSI